MPDKEVFAPKDLSLLKDVMLEIGFNEPKDLMLASDDNFLKLSPKEVFAALKIGFLALKIRGLRLKEFDILFRNSWSA